MSLIKATHGTKVPEIRIHRGMRLAAARQQAGITQEQMGRLLGCNRRTIGRWEGDDTSAPPAVIIAYSVATDVNLGWLQSGERDRLTPDFDSFANAEMYTPRDSNPEPTDYGLGALANGSLAAGLLLVRAILSAVRA